MSKLNVFLVVCLIINGLLAAIVLWQARAMQRWASSVPDQAPIVDPRLTAARLSREIDGKRSVLRNRVLAFRKLVLPTETTPVAEASDEQADQDAPMPDGKTEAVGKTEAQRVIDDRRVRQILSRQIGFHEIDELRLKLDPDRVALPSQVTLYNDAMLGWVSIRKRWPQPMGNRELDTLTRYTGLHPTTLSAMDQRIPTHVNRVLRGLKSMDVDVADAVDWLSKEPRPSLDPSGIRRRQQSEMDHQWKAWCQSAALTAPGLSGDSIPSGVVLERWINLLPFSKLVGKVEALSGVSRLNHPAAWDRVTLAAGSNRMPPNDLLVLQDHAVWHLAKHSVSENGNSAGANDVLNALDANPRFPAAMKVLSREASDDEATTIMPSDQMSMTAAIEAWLTRLQSGTPQDEVAVYREMLMIGPEDRLRPQVQALASGYRPASDLARSLAAALWCRWATEDDGAMLVMYATSSERTRSSPDDPDATAEAIETLCSINPAHAGRAAAHWVHQPRWPRSVSQAWVNSGTNGETALCGALLASLAKEPGQSAARFPAGFQRVLDVLAKSGGRRSLATLDTFESLSPESDRPPTVDRFLRGCRSRIERRIARENPGGRR